MSLNKVVSRLESEFHFDAEGRTPTDRFESAVHRLRAILLSKDPEALAGIKYEFKGDMASPEVVIKRKRRKKVPYPSKGVFFSFGLGSGE